MCVHTVSNRFFLIRIWSVSISPFLEAEPPVKHSGENPRNEELLSSAVGCAIFFDSQKRYAIAFVSIT
jgi:hypothetical protein